VNRFQKSGENKRTQNKSPNSLIVKQRPRQTTIGEDLDAANRECIDIHRCTKPIVTSIYQFWCLPSEGFIWTRKLVLECGTHDPKHTSRGSPTRPPYPGLHFTLAKIGYDTAGFGINEDISGLFWALPQSTDTRARHRTLRLPCNALLSCKYAIPSPTS